MGQKNRKHWPKQVRTMSKISDWVSVSRTYTSSTETEPHNIKYYYVQVVLRKFLVLYWQATRVLTSKLKKKREKAKGNRFFFSSYFGMFSECIHDFDFDFDFCVCVCVCLVFGCWENVEKQKKKDTLILLVMECSFNPFCHCVFVAYFCRCVQ